MTRAIRRGRGGVETDNAQGRLSRVSRVFKVTCLCADMSKWGGGVVHGTMTPWFVPCAVLIVQCSWMLFVMKFASVGVLTTSGARVVFVYTAVSGVCGEALWCICIRRASIYRCLCVLFSIDVQVCLDQVCYNFVLFCYLTRPTDSMDEFPKTEHSF